jgi:hypothetical protein
MSKLRVFLLLTSFLIVGSFLLSKSAQADDLFFYVGVTCDHASNRALVRFGYGDSSEEPVFGNLPTNIDGGLSQLAISRSGDSDASCTMPDGVEVKVHRYLVVTSREADGTPRRAKGVYDVSVGQNLIISKEDADRDFRPIPFGVIVDKNGYRRCAFELGSDEWVYDLTSSATPGSSVSIRCAAHSTPILR